MTDFERKSDKSKQQAAGDPLLELTRLFGTRPRPISAHVSYGGENQQTGQLSGFDHDEQSRPSPAQEAFAQEEQGTAVEQGESAEAWYDDDANPLPPYYPEEAGGQSEFAADPSIDETRWTGSDWQEETQLAPPPAWETLSTPPVAFEGEYWQETSPENGDAHNGYEDNGEAVQPAPSFVAAAAVEPSPKSKLVSAIANPSFGYGRFVQITPQLSLTSAPNAPQQHTAASQSPSTDMMQTVAPEPAAFSPAPMPMPSKVEPVFPVDPEGGDLNEALQDFDLTIPRARRHYRSQPPPLDPALSAAQISENQLEETGNFDLPPVPYGTELPAAGNVTPPPLSPSQAQPPYSGASRPHQAPPPQLPEVEVSEGAMYDWGAAPPSVATATKSSGKGRSRLIGIFVLLLLAAAGAGGYYAYQYYGNESSEPVIITADPDEVRIVPEATETPPSIVTPPAIRGNDEAAPPAGGLLDGRETPLNMERLEEQVPLSDETSLEPRAIEQNILTALARATPVHFVPTVIVRRDRDGNLVDVSRNNNEPETIVRPGADYSASVANARALQAGDGTAGRADTPAMMDGAAIAPNDTPPQAMQGERLPAETNMPDELAETTEIVSGNDVRSLSGDRTTNIVGGETEPALIDNAPHIIPPKPEMPPQQVAQGEISSTLPTASRSAEITNNVPALPVAGNGAAVGSGDFYVQIASHPTQALARQSADEAQRQFASLIGGRQILIVPADIPGRGIYYRVRIATGERTAAINLCEQYKQAGGSCFIGR